MEDEAERKGRGEWKRKGRREMRWRTAAGGPELGDTGGAAGREGWWTETEPGRTLA